MARIDAAQATALREIAAILAELKQIEPTAGLI